jgi:hypothetical protein
MPSPENPPSTAPAEPSRWTMRLRWFGQRAIVTVLLVMLALWLHELFVDPKVRQAWKLKVLMVLIPLGVSGSVALLLAWLLEWKARRKP